ncbi:MAG: DUF479 domain-containing protein [Proteobacteria bacterium]|nr:DUF479 domain-containing protein [Pseudomonadota bacterium]HQR03372.1 ACP phosphodiesterase [Rhodocyclaceae bacterium]
MNFLAHAWLAGAASADRIGGLIGDFIKGSLPGGLPADIAAGVELHRRIDSYADRHPAFIASRARVSAERRRYGGIMVDMFYDHFLALHWHEYHPQSLAQYVGALYEELASCPHLPPSFIRTLGYMREEDWLGSYRGIDAISLTLDRLAEYRLRQPNRLGGAGEELEWMYAEFEADFRIFIRDAAQFSASHRAGR